MTYRNYYSDGTVSVSNGSTTVTGSGTAWELFGIAGGVLFIAGFPPVPIDSVTDDNELVLKRPWPNATQTGVSYDIGLISADAATALFINRNLSEILRRVIASGVPPDGIGSLTERDALDPVPATGFVWLRAEVGEDLAYYFKTDEGWLGPKTLKGDPGPAGANGIGDYVEIAANYQGRPRLGEIFPRHVFTTEVTFLADLEASRAGCVTAADAEAVFSIRKNGVEFATVTFDAEATTGAFACPTNTTFAAGDVLTIVAPDPRDDTLADVFITLAGNR